MASHGKWVDEQSVTVTADPPSVYDASLPTCGPGTQGPCLALPSQGTSWWRTFATEFFKLSGGPGNVPTCAEQALIHIAGEFVPAAPSGASVISATAPAAQAVAINQSIAQTQAG